MEAFERAPDVALVAAGSFVLLLLEFGVFDEYLAIFAPILGLCHCQLKDIKCMHITDRRLPVLRHVCAC